MQSRSLASHYQNLKQWFISHYLSPLFNPFSKVRCPYCLEKFYPGHAAVVNRLQHDAHGEYVVLTPAPSKPGWRGFLARCWVRSLYGGDDTRVDPRRQCPNPTCKKLWPPLIERAENLYIAILGARGSGKSCYIAVTIKALEQAISIESLGLNAVRPLSAEVAKAYHDAYNLFLEKKVPILPTTAITQPLMYELTFQAVEGGSPRTVNIILYDVPGETLAIADRARQEAPFLFHASAIIYFADPLAIDSVWERWKHEEGIGERPELGVAEVLVNLAPDLARAHHPRTFPGPVALALSKSDLVEGIYLEGVEEYLFAGLPTYGEPKGKIRQQEFDTINHEVKRLLNALDQNTPRTGDLDRLAGQLLGASELFPKHLFFAVSATGCRPTKGVYVDFHPRRCLDPLFWILSKLKIIEIA